MNNKNISKIKHAQKESFYFKELSKILQKLSVENLNLNGIYITEIKLSPDKSLCNIYLHSKEDKKTLSEKLKLLICYKPSIRKNLSQLSNSRYTPELIFKTDENFEKKESLEAALEKISAELKKNNI